MNLAITLAAFAVIAGLALARRRLPRAEGAPEFLAKAVLGFTLAIAAWSAIVVPLLPVSAVTGALLEHLILAITATLSVTFATASWLGR